MSDADRNRHLAERKIERIKREIEFAGEQVGSWSRWLTASLLAINGGGALATINQSQNIAFNWNAGIAFAAGIVSAILSGTLLQELYNRRITPILECDDYWIDVQFSGIRDLKNESELRDKLDRAQRFSPIAPLLGWASGLLFLAGGYLLATRGLI